MQTTFNLQHELEDLREFLVNEGICSLCKIKGRLQRDDVNGVITCLNCGCTQPIYSPEMRCSGVGNNEGRHDAPVNELCYGRNLGSNMSDRDIFQIIRKQGTFWCDKCEKYITKPITNAKQQKICPFCNTKLNVNLGIRKIQIRNEIMKSQEKPITQRIKTYLSRWSKQFGWADKFLFANALGTHAQWMGTCLTMVNDGRNTKELAKGLFELTVKRFFGDEKISLIEAELKPKKLFVTKARYIIILDKLVK